MSITSDINETRKTMHEMPDFDDDESHDEDTDSSAPHQARSSLEAAWTQAEPQRLSKPAKPGTTEAIFVTKLVDNGFFDGYEEGSPSYQARLTQARASFAHVRQSVITDFDAINRDNILTTALTARGLDDLPTTTSAIVDGDLSDTDTTSSTGTAGSPANAAPNKIRLQPGVSLTSKGSNLLATQHETSDSAFEVGQRVDALWKRDSDDWRPAVVKGREDNGHYEVLFDACQTNPVFKTPAQVRLPSSDAEKE